MRNKVEGVGTGSEGRNERGGENLRKRKGLRRKRRGL